MVVPLRGQEALELLQAQTSPSLSVITQAWEVGVCLGVFFFCHLPWGVVGKIRFIWFIGMEMHPKLVECYLETACLVFSCLTKQIVSTFSYAFL